MGTITLLNTATVYPDLPSLFTAIDGVDYSGNPALVEVSGEIAEAPGIVTFNAPNGVYFAPAVGEEWNGVKGVGAGLRPFVADNSGFLMCRTGSLIRFIDLSLELKGQYTGRFFSVDEFYPMNIEATRCYVAAEWGVTDTTNGETLNIRTNNQQQRLILTDCVIETGGGLHSVNEVGGNTDNTDIQFNKCTLVDVGYRRNTVASIESLYPYITFTDTYTADGVPADISGSVSPMTNCATSDGTAYGTGAVPSVSSAAAFENKAGKDYRLKAGSPLIGAGTGGGNIGSSVGLVAGPDTIAPVISLNANTVVQLEVGDTYIPAVPTALDNVDGDITVDIITTGAIVDTGAIGTYVRLHNVSDAAGNSAVEVTETINVTAAVVLAPAGVPVVDAVSKTDISASVDVTYAGSDATGLEYSIDGGTTAVAFTSPAVLNGLTQDTLYPFTVRAVNAVGPGAWSVATNVRTDAAAPPVLTGVRGDAVPSTGLHSASVIYQHLNLPAENADIFRAAAVAPALIGLTLNQDGSYFVTDLTLGVYEFGYQIYRNNVAYGPVHTWRIAINAA